MPAGAAKPLALGPLPEEGRVTPASSLASSDLINAQLPVCWPREAASPRLFGAAGRDGTLLEGLARQRQEPGFWSLLPRLRANGGQGDAPNAHLHPRLFLVSSRTSILPCKKDRFQSTSTERAYWAAARARALSTLLLLTAYQAELLEDYTQAQGRAIMEEIPVNRALCLSIQPCPVQATGKTWCWRTVHGG